jgi:signal transduction histidine kinase
VRHTPLLPTFFLLTYYGRVFDEVKEELEKRQREREQYSAQSARKVRRILHGIRRIDKDEESLKDLRSKVESAVKQFQVRLPVRC